ncbi:MAG: thymidine kinase, partial [Cellulosimicrobium funkei]
DVRAGSGEIGYEVLCRRHHMRRMTTVVARRHATEDGLPLDLPR